MKYENALTPNDKQMKEFTERDIGTPIYMVNLLKFKKKQYIKMEEKQISLVMRLMQSMEWK